MKRLLLSWITFLGAIAVFGASTACADDLPPGRQRADAIVNPLLEQKKINQVVVGIIDAQGKRHWWAYGEKPPELESLDDHTLFEIGSITKVFTALLLADAVTRGEAKLSDSVQSLLPASMIMPKRGEREITLEELATHTSGLPRIPGNLMSSLAREGAARNPYSLYDEKLLTEALKNAKLPDEEKPKVAYSNLGVGLLGFALSKKLGKPYEVVLRERILVPFEMNDSFLTIPEAKTPRLIAGHDQAGKQSVNWTFQDTTAGAGGLRSTASDMLTFLECQMGRKPCQLKEAMALTQKTYRPAGGQGSIGLGWFCPPIREKQAPIWWHNGGTGGYSSFAAFCSNPKVGVVVLANRFIPREMDKLGMEVIADLLK